MLKYAEPGQPSCLTASTDHDEVWDHLPAEVQNEIIDKKLKFYVIDAYDVAEETGWAPASTPLCKPVSLQSAVYLPRDEAIEEIKKSIKKTYGKRGEAVVNRTTLLSTHL